MSKNGIEAKLCPAAAQANCEAGTEKALFLSPGYIVFLVTI